MMAVDEPWGSSEERTGGALDCRQFEMDTSTKMEETIRAFAQQLVKADAASRKLTRVAGW